MDLSALLASAQDAAGQGLLWSVMAIGLYISFKILDYADMTVDGSFALGGCVSAWAIAYQGLNPFFALFIAFFAGCVAGAVTGLLHTLLKIPPILAGILTMLALYSINQRILGQPNLSMSNEVTVFNAIGDKFNLSRMQQNMVIGVIAAAISIALLYWFFGTKLGTAIRATGNNENMVRAMGINTDVIKIIGLLLANGFVALSGSLVAQSQSYGDINSGVGAIVIGLASVIIGEVFFGKDKSFAVKLISVVVGSIVYRIIVAVVLQLGLQTNDLKLLTASLVALALGMQRVVKYLTDKKVSQKIGEEGEQNA
ncbi:ABC transporter permease [Scatolibacter rhodanostii]|uniref:ABC transporter permease n=1 Tax=Scatolibacter rhodanostii TaxID=2014781 RepID=UPI00190EB743|nr:ABC transporter permease [Scatolibacter rhodanostii]